MAHIVVMGAGIGGMPLAFEMRALATKRDRITVISEAPKFHFVPSNPWVAVSWRKRANIEIDLGHTFGRKGIDFVPVAAKRVNPDKNQVELADGKVLDYDYLVVATGPKLAFDEVEGLGPKGYTQSICHIDHAEQAEKAWQEFVKAPGPIVVGAAQGASCFESPSTCDDNGHRFAPAQNSRQGADHVVTSEPYIGHLGLGGVGDSKGMIESEMRDRHIKWICNAKTTKVEDGKLHVTEFDDAGKEKRTHELGFKYSMMLPAFKGVDAVFGIEGLTNPRGFILIDEFQRNPKFKNIYAVGVCVAIPPVEVTPVPTGAPKTGYMIESMVTATVRNIRDAIDGKEPSTRATWNAVCLADFGDTGIAFVALPQIPPRNVNWFSEGKWVHLGKVAFEKYFLRKMKAGTSEPVFEKFIMKTLGIMRLKG